MHRLTDSVVTQRRTLLVGLLLSNSQIVLPPPLLAEVMGKSPIQLRLAELLMWLRSHLFFMSQESTCLPLLSVCTCSYDT